MDRDDIIKVLSEEGYTARKEDIVKNGVSKKAVVILQDGGIGTVIYTDEIMAASKDIDMAVGKILEAYDLHRDVPFSADVLHDRKWIYDHLTIALQKNSTETLVKKNTEFDGIEQYLILICNDERGSFSIKVAPTLLSEVGISETDAWTAATVHLECDTQLIGIGKILSEFIPGDALPIEDRLYVATNSRRVKGAAAILDKGMLSEFAREHGADRLVILPSSIHEMLVMPYEEDFSLDELSAMVKEINAAQVSPEERLTDTAYIISV